jgi:ABC-type multidrug transport system ATPase subunit
LILDEATSSIDVHSERIVQAALERVLKDRTTILIAHRLSTVRKADHIIVMKDGTNVEEGSHDELMAACGVYSNLVHAQELGNAPVFEHRAGEKKEEVSYPLPVETADEVPVASTQPEKNGEHIEQGLWKSRKSPKSSTKILLRILREQQKHWVLYTLTLVGAIGASCKSLDSGFAI